ncbi:hypothetical protein [Ensifer soli]|uniref:hypothetical protein n=1 Tax=Ciceribacter sp. sgz301302 TaxID=3342379 RepID=UPI0035B939E0
MNDDHLYRIVEVSLKRSNGRSDVGIMTVRQALELPVEAVLEYSDPDLNSRSGGRAFNREQLVAYASG